MSIGMPTPKYPKVLGYDLIEQIGGGTFSRVFRAVHIQDHRVAACKVITLTSGTTLQQRKTIEKEMRIHSALKHNNILEFLEAAIVEIVHIQRFAPGIYMLLELAAGGDLFDKIAPDVGVVASSFSLLFVTLTHLATKVYIHREGVCHRDLKPENILLDVVGTLKIADFGLSSVFKLKQTGQIRLLTERCGTLPYVAPELDGDQPYNAEPIDVWAVGVILYALLAGNTPWDEPTRNSPEFVKYMSGEIFALQPWCSFGADALSLLQGLLTVDPRDRFTLDAAIEHPWCIRTAQLERRDPASLAQALTKSLRSTGDLDVATLGLGTRSGDGLEDDMFPGQSQFTQTLMLFSQTQSGSRYTPHLTRFYAALSPEELLPLVHEAIWKLGANPRNAVAKGETSRLRIGGLDIRKEIFKGWVEMEPFEYDGWCGSFCVMKKDTGNPISWRRLWRAVIQSEYVEPHVLRKENKTAQS
ncbi:CAMK/CAMKL/CHK1 protein kinase [Mycena crocata]|nr:CAMK/CAMKL/CHK1 protein kinase [Mycena crocata]